MSQITDSPLFIDGTVREFFHHLEDRKIPDTGRVCKFWYKIAKDVHQTNNKMLNRMIEVMSPEELAAKTDIDDIKSFKKCACKIVNKLFQLQSEEIGVLNSCHREPKVAVEPLQKKETTRNVPENFIVNQQNIRDYNLGIALYLTGQFKRNDRTDLLEMGKEARTVIKNMDPTFKLWHDPTSRAPNIFDLSLIGFKDCGLTEFSPEICLLHQDRGKPLTRLILEKNKLSYLPEEIKDLAELEVLELNDNSFRLFPKPILQLKQLQHLNLSNNPLTSIPPEIFQLQKLQELNLKHCTAITFLPNELALLPELRNINLSGTCIQSFPEEIMLCKNRALVHAMISHLFAELIVKLCEKNNEELYKLISLLPEEVKSSLRDHVYLVAFGGLTPSIERFLNTVRDGRGINSISLLKAFIMTALNLGFDEALNPNQNGDPHKPSFWELFNHLQLYVAKWTPERFENARIKFLEDPMHLNCPSIHTILSDQTSEFGREFQLSDEDSLKALCGLFHAL